MNLQTWHVSVEPEFCAVSEDGVAQLTKSVMSAVRAMFKNRFIPFGRLSGDEQPAVASRVSLKC